MGLFNRSEMLNFDVTGMSCGNCSGKVTKLLQALAGVKKVDASHENDTVSVTGKNLNEELIRATIDDAGYKVQ
jgi:copper chaperone CopZ